MNKKLELFLVLLTIAVCAGFYLSLFVYGYLNRTTP